MEEPKSSCKRTPAACKVCGKPVPLEAGRSRNGQARPVQRSMHRECNARDHKHNRLLKRDKKAKMRSKAAKNRERAVRKRLRKKPPQDRLDRAAAAANKAAERKQAADARKAQQRRDKVADALLHAAELTQADMALAQGMLRMFCLPLLPPLAL